MRGWVAGEDWCMYGGGSCLGCMRGCGVCLGGFWCPQSLPPVAAPGHEASGCSGPMAGSAPATPGLRALARAPWSHPPPLPLLPPPLHLPLLPFSCHFPTFLLAAASLPAASTPRASRLHGRECRTQQEPA